MKRNLEIIFGVCLLALAAPSAHACATCYGASDSPLAQGMNWGIITLLGVVGSVLFGIAAFFVHIGVKSAKLNADGQSSTPTDKI
ncbi:MAG: hypothetical protein EPO07_16015, partial [Verrucomicrobia bacterium]